MKSGLYACAGASATASAAAWAKRFEEPITNESNVYFTLKPPLYSDGVAYRRADQAEEVPLDPVAGELARNGEHEGLAVEGELVDVTEPLAVRPVAERLSQPPR